MATIMRFLYLTADEAITFRTITQYDENKLIPRELKDGPKTGGFVLPLAVLFDPAYADKRLALSLMPQIPVDIETEFGPEEV